MDVHKHTDTSAAAVHGPDVGRRSDRQRERKYSNSSVTDKNKLRHFHYLVGQDVNVVSDVSGLDLVPNVVLILLTLQTLGVGFLHYIHLMHKKVIKSYFYLHCSTCVYVCLCVLELILNDFVTLTFKRCTGFCCMSLIFEYLQK